MSEDWFTVEKLDCTTYAISEYRHWEETHCYLLCGTQTAVLIDTGLGISNIKNVVESLTRLPVLAVTTHVHWDHIGGHKYFEQIAVFEKEKEWLTGNFPIPLQMVKKNIQRRACDFPKEFDIHAYQIFQGMPSRILHDGDMIDMGNRRLEVIHTPGHSPGHCCFYESERGYLYAGDLVYRGCLDAFYPTTDPQLFLESVQKIGRLPVKKLLPGHHQLEIPPDMIKRIEKGFLRLKENGELKQGNGIYDFGDFQIHI